MIKFLVGLFAGAWAGTLLALWLLLKETDEWGSVGDVGGGDDAGMEFYDIPIWYN